MSTEKYRILEIVIKIIKVFLLLLLLYLMLCTNFFTIVKYNIIFMGNRDSFVDSKNSLVVMNTMIDINVKKDGTENYEDLKKAGVKLISVRGRAIYFQLWANRKYGRGILYTESDSVEEKINIDWAYKIEEHWYVYQEH